MEKTYLEELLIIFKVLKDKCYHSVFCHFDLFEKVDRIYPEDNYSWKDLLKPADHIIDNIYLGSAFNAADFKWLESNQIDIVVNVTPSISNFYPEKFIYHRFPADDLEKGTLKDYYDQFCQIVEDHPDQKILVHCYAGRSRSASLVLYYLMVNHQMGLQESLNFLKTQRQIINLNQEFVEEISEMTL